MLICKHIYDKYLQNWRTKYIIIYFWAHFGIFARWFDDLKIWFENVEDLIWFDKIIKVHDLIWFELTVLTKDLILFDFDTWWFCPGMPPILHYVNIIKLIIFFVFNLNRPVWKRRDHWHCWKLHHKIGHMPKHGVRIIPGQNHEVSKSNQIKSFVKTVN